MRTWLQRASSVALLAAWLTPGAGAAAISLHLASEAHDHERQEHARSVADLLRAAAHGHHHELGSTPDHSHDARLGGAAPAPAIGPDSTAVALLAPLPSLPAARAEGDRLGGSHRRGPPATPLFTAHCSLLL